MKRSPTPQEYAFLEAARQRLCGAVHHSSVEDMITSPTGLGVTTAEPLQRAIWRLIDGQPLDDLRRHEHVMAAIGDVDHLEGIRPKMVVLNCGIRGLKSGTAAAAGIRSPHVVDCSPMARYEGGRFSVVSTSKDNAKQVLNHALGYFHGDRGAQERLEKEPTMDTLTLPGPQGREFEFKVVAGARAGSTLVSRWSSGVVFDEAGRMRSGEEGVINLRDGLDAISGRLLPNAQIFLLSSPHKATGEFYDIVTKHFQKPTPEVVVIWAEGPWMNSRWWTPERCAELKRRNPRAYKTDVKAQFLDDDETLYPMPSLEQITLKQEYIPYEDGHDYAATIDPATRGNAWTLVVCDRVGRTKRLVYANEWIGSAVEPLSPEQVLSEIADILREYKLDWAFTDQWAADALVDLARQNGVTLLVEDWNQQNKVKAFTGLQTAVLAKTVKLIDNVTVRRDLNMVQKRPTQTGFSIVLPKTSDGRHCDYAPALAKCLSRWIQEDEQPDPEFGTPEYYKKIEDEMREEAFARVRQQKSNNWWEAPPQSIGNAYDDSWLE